MSLQLPDSIWSAEDLKAVIAEVQAYSKWFSAMSIKQRVSKATTASEPPTLSPAAIAILKAANAEQVLTQATLDQLILALQDRLSTSDQVTITLASPAATNLKKSLVAWCRENIEPNTLVNFRFNATILGGMVLQYGSRIYDWSFRRQILEKRSSFSEVLRHV